MIMAWWRGAPYASRMRFFRDSDAETPVEWKLARRGALDFPLYHLFHLSVLEDRPTGPRWPVGEVPGSVRGQKVWRRSTLPGVCFTGTPEQWATGCLLADPVPAKDPCCLPPWVLPIPIVIGLDFLWGTVVTLLVEQYDGTGQVPTTTVLDFDEASRLVVDSLGSGHAGVRWLGVRGYHAGDGYFGPQPDIEFLDGGGVAWTVTEDAVNKRIVVGAVASGGGGGAGLTYGTATDESAYTLTTTSARTGWSVTLPDPGRYFLWAHARIDASATGAAGLVEFSLSLVNATTPANLVLPSNGVGYTHRFAPGDLATVVATVPVAGYIVTTTPDEVVELHAAYLVLTGVAPAFMELLGSSVALQYLRLDGPGGGSPGPPGPPGPPGSMTLGTTPVTGGTPGEFLVVGPGGTLSQSPGGGGGSLGIGTTPVAGGTPGDVLTVGPDGSLGQVTAPSGTPTGPAGGALAGAYPNPTFARPPAFTDGANEFTGDQAVDGQVSASSFLATGAVPGVLPGFFQLVSADGLGALAPYGFAAPAAGTGVPGGVMWTLPPADAAGVLASDGSGNLTFGPAGGTPTGPAGGDLGGSFPNAEVVAVDGGTWE